MKHSAYLIITAGLLSSMTTQAAILITQYYEGTSSNKWIEITNTGNATVDLGESNYVLSIWQNANTEAYKTDGIPSQSMSLSGVLTAGASFLYENSNATLPAYAIATASNNNVINFNGDDSITLWIGTNFTTGSIIDAIGFTDAGNEGANISIVRRNTDVGWNSTSGSTFEDFTSVWEEVTNAAVDGATEGTEARLGYSFVTSPAPVPEPSTALLGGLGVLALLRRRRLS